MTSKYRLTAQLAAVRHELNGAQSELSTLKGLLQQQDVELAHAAVVSQNLKV